MIVLAGVAFLLLGSTAALAQQAESQVMTTTKEAPKIPSDRLDSLVAPIALYPDPLLSQTLLASTYPLEIIQLQQWMEAAPVDSGSDYTLRLLEIASLLVRRNHGSACHQATEWQHMPLKEPGV